jgi:hypothetical protein
LVYKKTYFGHPKDLLVILKWLYMRVLHLRLGFHIKFTSITYGLFQYKLHAGFTSRPCLHSKAHPNYILGILKQPYMWVLYLKLPFHYRFYLNHLWVILKWTWIWLLHLRLRFHIKFQYPHMYLLSPITNLALFF